MPYLSRPYVLIFTLLFALDSYLGLGAFFLPGVFPEDFFRQHPVFPHECLSARVLIAPPFVNLSRDVDFRAASFFLALFFFD